MAEALTSWRAVADEVLARIRRRDWAPGDLIPNEVDLAGEMGCARTTVNRALRHLAEAGYLERRRKAGTCVALNPVRHATLRIPVIREEVEARGAHYDHALILREEGAPPLAVRSLLHLPPDRRLLHVVALHLADGAPYAHEDRWVDTETVPDFAALDLTQQSANAWLVQNVPYTRGTLALSAIAADPATAEALGCAPGAALFTLERTTWKAALPITWVRLAYPPGHRLTMDL
jgi:GntR family histidine utilization transcriptional repressor